MTESVVAGRVRAAKILKHQATPNLCRKTLARSPCGIDRHTIRTDVLKKAVQFQ